MAKKKTRILWLYLWQGNYELYDKKPEWEKEHTWWDGDVLYEFCSEEFQSLFPALKLHKNTLCKLKLTQLKNGIKLERVK